MTTNETSEALIRRLDAAASVAEAKDVQRDLLDFDAAAAAVDPTFASRLFTSGLRLAVRIPKAPSPIDEDIFARVLGLVAHRAVYAGAAPAFEVMHAAWVATWRDTAAWSGPVVVARLVEMLRSIDDVQDMARGFADDAPNGDPDIDRMAELVAWPPAAWLASVAWPESALVVLDEAADDRTRLHWWLAHGWLERLGKVLVRRDAPPELATQLLAAGVPLATQARNLAIAGGPRDAITDRLRWLFAGFSAPALRAPVLAALTRAPWPVEAQRALHRAFPDPKPDSPLGRALLAEVKRTGARAPKIVLPARLPDTSEAALALSAQLGHPLRLTPGRGALPAGAARFARILARVKKTAHFAFSRFEPFSRADRDRWLGDLDDLEPEQARPYRLLVGARIFLLGRDASGDVFVVSPDLAGATKTAPVLRLCLSSGTVQVVANGLAEHIARLVLEAWKEREGAAGAAAERLLRPPPRTLRRRDAAKQK